MQQKLEKAQNRGNSLFKGKIFSGHYSQPFWCCVIAVFFITIITLTVYQSVLFNFFITDEFIMVNWLRVAIKNPLLIGQEFFHLWMNHLYYRPLESVILALQYSIWGANVIWFRLTTIFCMLVSSYILGLIAFELDKTHKARLLWAILSAAMFSFYPLHGEPINWFVAQHDASVTLFCLLSFWFYLRWRYLSYKFFLLASLCSMTCGLLIKEMAVILPLLLLSYELICLDKSALSNRRPTFFNLSILRNALLRTIPYWLVLTTYFCVRKLVLGTFIGSLSVNYYSGQMYMIRTWLHTVKQILIPIDNSTLNRGNGLYIMWLIPLILALSLSFYAFKKFNSKGLGLFTLLWFIISLVPAYKLLIIGSDLSGSRIAYLATAPLCLFLTYGIAKFSFDMKYAKLVHILGALLCFAAIILIYTNNQAYCKLGLLSNRIISQLQKYYQTVNGDPETRILGLPAITAGAIGDMTKLPFIGRDIFNCYDLNAGDQLVSFGILKDSIDRKENRTNFLYWDAKTETLNPVAFHLLPKFFKKNWQGRELKSSIVSIGGSPVSAAWESGDILHIVSNQPVSLEINLKGLPCWMSDFITFSMQVAPRQGNKSLLQAELHFSNNIVQNYSDAWNAYSRVNITPSSSKQNVIFPLRGFPDWIMGDKCNGLKLLLPRHCDLKLSEISIPETESIIPKIYLSAPIHLGESPIGGLHTSAFLRYDASQIKNCAQVILEIIDRNKDFEFLYAPQANRDILYNVLGNNSSGVLEIERSSFPDKGLYKGRLRALSQNGGQVGLSSDYFLIYVDQ